MKTTSLRIALLALGLLGAGCASGPRPDTVVQIAVIDGLLAGDYAGKMTCAELLKHGDTGIGTFDSLDGEMIVDRGVVYRAAYDGTIHEMPSQTSTPFAVVAAFRPDRELEVVGPLDYAAFQNWLAPRLAPNLFYVIRLEGEFSRVKVRSVPRQRRPFPPLEEAVKRQSVFEGEKLEGRLVGVYSPPFVKGVNVPGFHLHFLGRGETFGGHVLDFELGRGVLELDACANLFLILPGETDEFQRLSLERDRGEELKKIEGDSPR